MRACARRAIARTLALAALVAGCERAEEAPPRYAVDSPEAVPAESLAVPRDLHGWNEAAGPALLVPGESPTGALVIFPGVAGPLSEESPGFDSASIAGARVQLFSRGGEVGEAVVAEGGGADTADACVGWPRVELRLRARAADPPPWLVGFVEGRATPLALDSLETLSRSDSARLTADIARMASTLPAEEEHAFRGLPFSVRSARRFRVAPGIEGLVAEVVRKITTEADPREERTLLVAERDVTRDQGRYTVAYFERSSGAEEAVVAPDVLAAVRIGPAELPTLVLSRDDGRAVRYVLVERVRPGQWRARWVSGYPSC